MKTIYALLLAGTFVAAPLGYASADWADDQLVKAEKRVANANKALEKAKACVADRVNCIATEQARIQKTIDNAEKRLANVQ